MQINRSALFRGRHFAGEIIVLCPLYLRHLSAIVIWKNL